MCCLHGFSVQAERDVTSRLKHRLNMNCWPLHNVYAVALSPVTTKTALIDFFIAVFFSVQIP